MNILIKDGSNLKDTNNSLIYKGSFAPLTYSKSDKLITALYMVTDVIEKDEPIRFKLRTLGSEILSDIYSNFSTSTYHLNKLINKINEALSFLEIATTLNLISSMNAGIIKKEFLELRDAVKALNPELSFMDMFKSEEGNVKEPTSTKKISLSYKQPTRLGVQKAATLMQALSNKIPLNSSRSDDFNMLKKQRQSEIIKILTDTGSNGLTITDIKTKSVQLKNQLDIQALDSCGEKTLQRELVSMVKSNVLNKSGAKRWSRYFLVNH